VRGGLGGRHRAKPVSRIIGGLLLQSPKIDVMLMIAVAMLMVILVTGCSTGQLDEVSATYGHSRDRSALKK
jgi:hypothetical protein